MSRTSPNWKAWVTPDDLPHDLRQAVRRGALRPLLDPAEAERLKRTILEAFAEVMEIYLEDNELKYRCEYVAQLHPDLPHEAVFRAVSLEVGVSVSRLRALWFMSRRKAGVRDALKASLKERP